MPLEGSSIQPLLDTLQDTWEDARILAASDPIFARILAQRVATLSQDINTFRSGDYPIRNLQEANFILEQLCDQAELSAIVGIAWVDPLEQSFWFTAAFGEHFHTIFEATGRGIQADYVFLVEDQLEFMNDANHFRFVTDLLKNGASVALLERKYVESSQLENFILFRGVNGDVEHGMALLPITKNSLAESITVRLQMQVEALKKLNGIWKNLSENPGLARLYKL